MRQRVYAPSQHRADVLLIVSETTFNRLGAFYIFIHLQPANRTTKVLNFGQVVLKIQRNESQKSYSELNYTA